MRRFIDQPLSEGQKLTLTDEDYNYIARVLRKREGEEITLFNGRGGEFKATIQSITRREILLQVGPFSPINRESSIEIHLFQALAKGEKMEFVLQKATELGVASITPLITERSVLNLKKAQLEKRLERWNNIILSACEQSGLNLPPKLHSPQKIDAISLPESAEETIPLLTLSPTAEQNLSEAMTLLNHPSAIAIIIGPEGGLSDTEIRSLEQRSARSVRLGERILRTETAALTVISSLHALMGDWAE